MSRVKHLMEKRLEELNWSLTDLAREYGKLRENSTEVQASRYRTTVAQVIEHPETARFETVRLCLKAMGYTLVVIAGELEEV